jgi:hypothetical protein
MAMPPGNVCAMIYFSFYYPANSTDATSLSERRIASPMPATPAGSL